MDPGLLKLYSGEHFLVRLFCHAIIKSTLLHIQLEKKENVKISATTTFNNSG